tara:strand:- start:62 stop:529 length:468 start_codon:yes stop_codon:yes gene_type:complete
MNRKKFKQVSLVTGGFDPLHSGHISYFKSAKELSSHLVVGINSDDWLERKKKNKFQTWAERANIITHLNMVDVVISWDDSDDSARGAIKKCLELADKVVFCNGGDRHKENIPEIMGCGADHRVEFKYSIGGDNKMNSSSWILQEYFDRQRKLLGI